MHERLSVLDASLLALESPSAPLHTGGVAIFADGPAFSDVHAALRARLDDVPLARRRLRTSPLGGRPVWVDDTDFDLSYHLRHAALPEPGGDEQLGEFVARLVARPLDRQRPLWELYVIEGLEGGRTALFHKAHLVMAGGEHPDPFAALLDEEPERRPGPVGGPWRPAPEPSELHLAAEGLRERLADAAAAARWGGRVALRPAGAAKGVVGAGLGLAGRALGAAARSPINRPLSPHRRFATAELALEELREVRGRLGGTVNDAVVAICADAVGRLLRDRGHETKDLDLRAMLPVRVHAEGEEGELAVAPTVGHGVVGVLTPLPVMPMDPVARLYRIMGELAGIKESRQAVAADRLARLAGYAPSALHAAAARLVIAEQRYDVALSNAPGPQSRRWLAGAPLEISHPFVPLSGDVALSIAVSSYAGRVGVGLLADRWAVPDVDRLARFLPEAMATLLEAAREAG